MRLAGAQHLRQSAALLAFAVLLVIALPAQPDDGVNDKFTVTGSVVDSVTGEPIRRALVQVMQRSGFTDDQGHFQFTGMTPTSGGWIQARKPGYFSEQEIGRASRGVTLSANMEPLTIKLVPQSIVHGRIISSSGEPLEQVPVRLMSLAMRNGHKAWNSRSFASTDENGQYRFANLMPGTYVLSAGPLVQHAGSEPAAGDEAAAPNASGYPTVYYPGVPDMNAAAPLNLAPGQQATADFNLTAGPVYKVAGTVVGAAAGQGVSLQAYSQSGDALPIATRHRRSANGQFVAYLPAGMYVLKANSYGPNGQVSEGRINLTVAGDLNDLTLTMQPSMEIPVEVRREDRTSSASSGAGGAGPSAVGRGIRDAGPMVTVHLVPTAPGMNDLFATMGVVPHKDFAIRNVEPGRYTAELTPVGNWYVFSAQYGQQNLLADDMNIVAGSVTAPIEIVLRDDVASLTGTVKRADGSETSARVLVISANSKRVLRTLSCAPNSEFNLGQMAPGEYLVVALDNVDNVESSNPEVLQSYLSQATRVSLSPSQQSRVELRLVSTGE